MPSAAKSGIAAASFQDLLYVVLAVLLGPSCKPPLHTVCTHLVNPQRQLKQQHLAPGSGSNKHLAQLACSDINLVYGSARIVVPADFTRQTLLLTRQQGL